MQFNH